MKFTCSRDELGKALTILMRVVSPSATLESLRGVRIEVADTLTLSATNLEIGIRVQVPCTQSEEGVVLINPRVLLDTIKYSDTSTVTIEKKGNTISVRLTSGTTTIKTLNESDFPTIPVKGENLPIQLATKGFVNGIRAVLYAVSRSVIKPELASVYVWQDGQELVFVATDSFRLAEKRISQALDTDGDTSLLIPQKNTQDLVGILEQLEDIGYLQVAIDKDQLAVKAGAVSLTVRTLDSAFPDYRKIIPTEATTTVTLLKKDISQILKKTSIFSDKFNKIRLEVGTDGLTVSTASQEVGEMSDIIKGVVEGESAQVSLNYQYVSDCLQSIESDSVTLSFYGQGKPVIVRGVGDKSFMYLVMPMNR